MKVYVSIFDTSNRLLNGLVFLLMSLMFTGFIGLFHHDIPKIDFLILNLELLSEYMLWTSQLTQTGSYP